MAVQEVEDTSVTEDKRVEDMTIEELEAAMNDARGQTEESEPQADEIEASAEDVKSETEPSEEVDSNEDNATESIEDQFAKLQKQIEHRQKLEARRDTEFGEMRKKMDSLLEAVKPKKEIDDDLMYENPKEYIEQILDEKLGKKDEVQQQPDQDQMTEDNKSYVTTKMPEFDNMIDDISEEIKHFISDEPDADNLIEEFKANPYTVNSLTLLGFGKVAELKRKLSDLEKQLKSDNGKADLVRKIKNVGKNKTVVNGGNNGGNNGNIEMQLTHKQIESRDMSPEKLEQLIRQRLEQQ